MEFIKQYKNVLGKNFCINTILKFEKDENKQKGSTVFGVTEQKKTLDLHSDTWSGEGWTVIYSVLQDALHSCIIKYYDDLGDKFNPYRITNDSGFQIQKYNANEGKYDFHNDFYNDSRGFRTLTYIFYLNDVDEGGETEFYNGEKVNAEEGKLLLFPSLWTYSHKGNMPISNDKYIVTGWIYSNY
jgi:hypothetical protein